MQFENKISLGNVLTIAALILAMATGWATLAAQLATLGGRMTAAEQLQRERVLIAESRASAVDARLRSSEVAIAGQSSELRSILSAISRVEAALQKLADKP